MISVSMVEEMGPKIIAQASGGQSAKKLISSGMRPVIAVAVVSKPSMTHVAH